MKRRALHRRYGRAAHGGAHPWPSVAAIGDFDALPLASHIEHGEVPLYPTSEDFQHAAVVAGGSGTAAAYWRREAVRWRLRHPGRPLNEGLKEIARATASALYREATGGRP